MDHARIEAQNHRFTFDEVCFEASLLCALVIDHDVFSPFEQPMGVEALTQSVCDLALGFGEGRKEGEGQKMSRPFGVSLLMAGYDRKEGPLLFFSDPSGSYFQFKAKAIGAGSEGAQATLQDKYRDDMTLAEAENLAFEILKQVMEEKISNINVEVASVTEKGYHLYTAAELDTVIARLA